MPWAPTGVAVDDEGKMTINWNTPEYLKALEWFVDMAQVCPAGCARGRRHARRASSRDENVVAIIPEGEQGYFIQPLIANPDLQKRFRTSFNLSGADGVGGVATHFADGDGRELREQGRRLDGAEVARRQRRAQKYYFDSNGRLPTSEQRRRSPAADRLVP